FSRSQKGRAGAEPHLCLGSFVHRGIRQPDGLVFPIRQLTRHALVAGFTGSGKTTTCMTILAELWRKHRIPWLVLEPAKAEYRELARVSGLGDDLRVFTLGSESCSPFRLNPLEPVAGYPLQAHLDCLRNAFFASVPMWEPLPRILERAIHEVFRGKPYDGHRPMEDPPVLRDLVEAVPGVVAQLGYDSQIRDRSIGALRARLESLLMGNKGAMLGCPHGIPMAVLMEKPTILELRWLTDQEERALLLALLLTRLYEHLVAERATQQHAKASQGLRHVTLFEEAHQLLSGAAPVGESSEQASAKSRSVLVFSNMLAEIRAYGEGLIIADQIPGKLVSDVVKNTDLKIGHTLRAPDDRKMMAEAMNLGEEEGNYLGILPTGQAVIHHEGLEKATLVAFPDFRKENAIESVECSDECLMEKMAGFHTHFGELFHKDEQCPVCGDEERCPYARSIQHVLEDKHITGKLCAAAFATLAGGDQRRKLLFLVSSKLRSLTHLHISREDLPAFQRCACVQVAGKLLGPIAEECDVPASAISRDVADFIACHEPLIQSCEDDPDLLRSVQNRFRALCEPVFLPSAGCSFCSSQCLFYRSVQTVLGDTRMRQDTVEAFNGRQADPQQFPQTCRHAVSEIVCGDEAVVPRAAYCFAALLFEEKGIRDEAFFRGLAEDLRVLKGNDHE
ncbi:MAG: ATP-binding protein, partial [Phycisphaerales bacterium]